MLVSKKDNICIIPARGGSKRIPSKNIKKFNNIPIIIRSIKKAIKTKLFDKIIVSTDNSKTADIAESLGASKIIIRPSELSKNYVGVADVIKFTLEEALEYIQKDEYVEVTPNHLRLRKILLKEVERKRGKAI